MRVVAKELEVRGLEAFAGASSVTGRGEAGGPARVGGGSHYMKWKKRADVGGAKKKRASRKCGSRKKNSRT